MPSYPYECLKCRCTFDDFRQISQRDEAGECPDCGSAKIRRLVSAPRVEGDISDWINDPGGKGRYCPQAARFPKDPNAYFRSRHDLCEWGKRKGLTPVRD